MAANKLKVIPDILEEHFEDLAFLWGQRQEALYSPDYTMPELRDLEERIEAHVQGLLVGGENTIGFVEDGLSQDEPLEVFAAAYTLLRLNIDSAARQVMDAFLQAEGPQLDGIREALCHGPIDIVMGLLHEAAASAPAPIAAAAAEALAFHRKLDPAIPQLAEFSQDKNAKVRRAAWRLIMLVSPTGQLSPDVTAQLSDAAMHDEDPGVRAEALQAAAWTMQPWLPEHCRKLCDRPHPDNAETTLLLAIIGKPFDLERILQVARAAELGPMRFHVPGAFGHPGVVEILLEAMQSKDPLTAAAAGAAFTKITGADIESDQKVLVLPEDGSEPNEFEQEFLDEVTLPDPVSAQVHWEQVKDEFSSGTRWCHGLNLSRDTAHEFPALLDMESRRQARLRGRFEAAWQGSLIDLEVFPQKRQ